MPHITEEEQVQFNEKMAKDALRYHCQCQVAAAMGIPEEILKGPRKKPKLTRFQLLRGEYTPIFVDEELIHQDPIKLYVAEDIKHYRKIIMLAMGIPIEKPKLLTRFEILKKGN